MIKMRMRFSMFLLTLLVAVILVAFGPSVLDSFAVNVLTRSMIYAMLVVTVDLLWGYTGILTFGQSAFFGVGAYAAAIVLTQLGFSWGTMALALLLALLLPMLLGLFVGWLSFHHNSTPLYASVISLVVPIIVMQLVYSGGTLTGSSSGLVGYEVLPLDLDGFFWLAGAALVVTASAAWIFARSDAGTVLKGIRDNEVRCAYLGLDTQLVKLLLTAILGGVAGLAGFLYANASGVVAPETTGFVFGTELVVWTAVGGRATVIGPVIGALGIDYLSASLSGDLPFLWQLVVGAIFVVMIILLPNGLAAVGSAALHLFSRKRNGLAVPEVVVQDTLKSKPAGSRQSALLSIQDLGKSYGSLNVLQGINLAVRPGELVSLVGPNGAGKTTLMRCLSDGTTPMTGMIEVEGRAVNGLTPAEVVGLGVGRKFQVASVFDSLTVADCLRLARARKSRPSPVTRSARLELPTASAEVLRLTGLMGALGMPVSALSHGQKQSLELAMVLALEPKIVLLDEPTAGLTKAERTQIGDILRLLTEQMNVAAILVEHDLDFVREVSSRIVVLHQGKIALDGSVDEVVNSELVRTIYSGAVHD